MFKIGDRVILLHESGVHTLQKKKSYKIDEIKRQYYDSNDFLRMEDDEQFYNEKRFKIDLSYVRNQKIKKMKWDAGGD